MMKMRRIDRNTAVIERKGMVPAYVYDTVLNSAAYGNASAMGDLFNDILGSVVPGWDNRPDWMKKIVVKPDPFKIASAAVKAVPPQKVGGVLRVADQYGMNMFYNTPAGQVPITADSVQGAYANFPALARMKQFGDAVPSWVIMAGGMGLFLLVFLHAKKR